MYVERNNPNGSGPQGQTGSSQSGSQGTMGSQNGTQGMNGSMQNGQNGQNGSPAMQKSGVDYRDDLRELLDKAHAERGLTRYRLCKQMGIDSGTLSNVLAKRRHFSLEKLEQILGLLGYRLTFTQQGEGMSAAPSSMN